MSIDLYISIAGLHNQYLNLKNLFHWSYVFWVCLTRKMSSCLFYHRKSDCWLFKMSFSGNVLIDCFDSRGFPRPYFTLRTRLEVIMLVGIFCLCRVKFNCRIKSLIILVLFGSVWTKQHRAFPRTLPPDQWLHHGRLKN